jgi:hypothetical protein
MYPGSPVECTATTTITPKSNCGGMKSLQHRVVVVVYKVQRRLPLLPLMIVNEERQKCHKVSSATHIHTHTHIDSRLAKKRE